MSLRQQSYTTDIAFTDSVKNVQERLGSRGSMQRLERSDSWPNQFDSDIRRWISARDSIFIGSASASGQPYVQHRGGEPGFIQIRDSRTLVIPDYPGNRQYITLGNLLENPRAFLFMMDYETQKRVKFWGQIYIDSLEQNDRQLVFTVTTWDVNCRQYIPALLGDKSVMHLLARKDAQIAALEEELRILKKPASL